MTNLKKYCFYLLGITIISIVGTVIINHFAPSFLLLSQDKIDTLTLTIWQIQALFTSVIIAINALALGFLNQKIYGVDVLEFSFIKDKIFPKTLKLSQLDIAFMMFAIVLINYFFVAYEALFGVLFLFILTILGIILIFTKTLILITQIESMRGKIKNYIFMEYRDGNVKTKREELINKISIANKESFNNDQFNTIILNSNLIIELSGELPLLKNKNVINNEEALKDKSIIEQELEEVIRMLFKRNRIIEATSITFQAIKHSAEVGVHLKIEREFFYLLFKELRLISFIPNNFHYHFMQLISLMDSHVLSNDVDDNAWEISYNRQFLATIISSSYKNSHVNINLNYEDKERFHRILRDFVYFVKSSNKHYYLMYLLRQTILEKDIKQFKFFLIYFNLDEPKNLKVQLTINIYLYYLVFKEELVKGSDYKVFFESIDFFTLNLYLNENKRNNFRDYIYFEELSNWEEMDEYVAKFMKMETSIKEFLILLEINNSDNLIPLIKGNDILSFINILSNKSNLTDRFIEINKGIDSQEIDKRIEIIKNKLLQNYIKNEIEQYSKIDISKINDKIAGTSNFKKMNELRYINNETILKNFEKNSEINTEVFPDQSVYPKLYFKEQHLWKNFLKNLENKVIKAINQITVHKLNNNVLLSNWSRNNKVNLLTNHLNKKHKTILTNLHSGRLRYFEKDNYANYQRNIEGYEVINISNVNFRIWLSTNKEKIKINFKSIDIKVRELTVKELEGISIKYKISNNLYELHLVNELKTEFSKEEAIEYLGTTNCMVETSISLGVKDENEIKNKLIVFK